MSWTFISDTGVNGLGIQTIDENNAKAYIDVTYVLYTNDSTTNKELKLTFYVNLKNLDEPGVIIRIEKYDS